MDLSANSALDAELATREIDGPIGVYVHVPYCARRCGYCDFNTYTADELGPGVGRDSWAEDVQAELRQAALRVRPRGVDTVFFGGGTPTLLAPEQLGAVLRGIDDHWGLLPGAEVTAEANPDSVDPAYLERLRAEGFNRLSVGMQSAQSHVLRVLDRTHDPLGALRAVAYARSAGFASVSLDLIYGTPGESLDDWRITVQTALDAEPDHLSAYALTVEKGTRMGAEVARGALPAPDPDHAAECYELVDDLAATAGLPWYEISNFAAPGHECRHNLNYWRNGDWWGLGPGAHSHLRGVRWWNVRHPRHYTAAHRAGILAVAGVEVPDAEQRNLEHVMLAIRLREGLPMPNGEAGDGFIDPTGVARCLEDGLAGLTADGRFVLTQRGRLLADRVTMALAP